MVRSILKILLRSCNQIQSESHGFNHYKIRKNTFSETLLAQALCMLKLAISMLKKKMTSSCQLKGEVGPSITVSTFNML